MAAQTRRERGSGSIFRRGNLYVAQVHDGYKEDGKPRYKQFYAKSQDEAVGLLNEFNAKAAAGAPLPQGRSFRLAKWLDTWLEDFIRPNREPRTYDFYKRYVDTYLKDGLGKKDLRRVRSIDIAKAFREMAEGGASSNTVDCVRRTLRAAYSVAVKNDLCAVNPVLNTSAPRVEREPIVYFNAEQVRDLLTALKDSPIEDLVRFTLATGLRNGEATGVTWDSIDLARATANITMQLQRVKKQMVLKRLKTEKSRRGMPLVGQSLEAVQNQRARRAVEGHENELNLVFLNPWGRPITAEYANDELHKVLEKAGLPKTGMHSLRHSAATFLLMNGLNLHQVSRYLGHSQIALTSNLYGHVLDGAMRSAAQKLQDSYQQDP